ncbi:hypothetical protein [Curtobacterium sp. PhB78]|uniref:hypothetical protein n=1 Tax=Curtobacterium sp. PhB78 TaxID=2485102 RepID=UPI000F492B56|nr:hypothetical protein [Curtobacterium sp. PhB78]ROS35253.1 hypothetical protein EDF53_2620 [Curtobacterium sp. PhB78]
MSDAIDIIEHMFEYEGMQTAAALRSPGPDRVGRGGAVRGGSGAARAGAARGGGAGAADHLGDARAALDRITSLRSRVTDMESTRVDTAGLPTASALEPLLPGGAIRVGGTYAVPESVLLAITMLQAASASGAWCAVVGVPSFGIEAAAAAGIDLERLVLVPDPGDQWLAVTAAMADVAQIVLTRPLGRVVPGDVARLSARLRQRGGALVALGSWPGADVTLRITSSVWSGIGQGHGHLTERRATVTATGRAGAVRPTSAELLLPAADGTVRTATPVPSVGSGDTRVLRPVAVAS